MNATEFRAALAQVAPDHRDAWVDDVFGIAGLGEDGPELPRGCVPYLPTSVATLQRVIALAGIQADDTFVDIGAGLGRVTTLVHLLTGATAIGLEIQPQLVREARALASRLGAERVSVLEGDAADLVAQLASGSVFYLYAPFSGPRLDRVLDALDALARSRPIRVCALNVPFPARASLFPVSVENDLGVYRS